MRFNALFTALAAAGCASAQSLTSLIGSYNQLSMLGDLLAAYPTVAAAVANLTDGVSTRSQAYFIQEAPG